MANNEESKFWNQVLQRFAASTQELAQITTERNQLADELEQAKEERDKLREELALAKKEKDSAMNVTPATTARHDIGTSASREQEANREYSRKLHELEAGISQAQESYRKSVKQLEENEAMIQDLLSSNQTLRSEHTAMELTRNECRDALKRANINLEQVRAENETLRERLQSRVREPVAPPINTQSPSHSEKALRLEIEKVYQPRIAALEREVEDLRNTSRKLEAERKRIQEELEVAQTKLNKIKSSKNSLQDQLKDLEELTRRGSLHSLSSSLRTTRSRATVLRSPSSLAVSSASKHGNGLSKQASAATMDGKTAVDITRIEDEDNAPTPRPSFTPFPIPTFRQNQIAKFPIIDPGVPLGSDNAFSRDFMTTSLGGSIQPLIVRVANQKGISKKRNLNSYLCPGIEHNPWCPSTPGQHGYIFVGLGREKDTFIEPEEHNVFVGLKKSSKDSLRRFKYLGKYRAVRVHALTIGEWSSLPQYVRNKYAKTTQEKTKDTRSVDAILRAYDNGELSVPCVQLQCIDFDKELYMALVSESAKHGKSKSSSSSSNKRTLDYEADDDCARKRQR